MNWWKKWPGRFDCEMNRLKELGWNPIDKSTLEDKERGYREVEFFYPVNEQMTAIRLSFPPEYPYFMATVFIDPASVALKRHQNPISGELCLLNGGRGWEPQKLMADIINEYLPIVINISDDPQGEFARQVEAAQGEPVTAYLPHGGKALLLVENINIPQDVLRGTFIAAHMQGVNRYVVLEVKDNTGTIISKVSEVMSSQFSGAKKVKGKWRRFDSLSANDLIDHKSLVRKIDPTLPLCFSKSMGKEKEFIVAAIFQEEIKQGVFDDAWHGVNIVSNNSKGGNKAKFVFHHLPSSVYSSDVRTVRSPELRELDKAHICVVGTGMLGSPFALQMARAGIKKLTLIDPDYIELATTIRFALGASYAEWSKVEALKDYINKNYPLVEVEAIKYRIGSASSKEDSVYVRAIQSSFENADLIVDAAAEKSVSYYLSQILRNLRKKSLIIASRPGTWGGEVWYSEPGGPCWECFERWQSSKDLQMPFGDDESDTIQFGGCAQPTTEGYGFESDQIVLQSVRKAAGLLTDATSGFPVSNWNALVVNLRDGGKGLLMTEYLEKNIRSHPDCSCRK